MNINQALAQIDEKENIPRRPKAKIQCKMALKQRKTSQKTENPKTYAGISAQTHKSKTLLKSTYNEKNQILEYGYCSIWWKESWDLDLENESGANDDIVSHPRLQQRSELLSHI